MEAHIRKNILYQCLSNLLVVLFPAANRMPYTAVENADFLLDFLCDWAKTQQKDDAIRAQTCALRTGFLFGNYEGRCALKHLVDYGINLYHDLVLREEEEPRLKLQFLASFGNKIRPGGSDYIDYIDKKQDLECVINDQDFWVCELMKASKLSRNAAGDCLYAGKSLQVNLTKQLID